jgi:DNA invertase Pin-like site-specific DNA recombinase
MAHTTAVAYIRVSTLKQAVDGLSLEAQRQKIQAYASLYELDIIGIDMDEGFSAKTLVKRLLIREAA